MVSLFLAIRAWVGDRRTRTQTETGGGSVSANSIPTTGKKGAKAGKSALRRSWFGIAGSMPARRASKLATKASRRTFSRRSRTRVEQLGDAAHLLNDAARLAGEVLAVHGPRAAYVLGLAEPPKPKRTAPRIAAGIVIGASAVYALELEHRATGARRRLES